MNKSIRRISAAAVIAAMLPVSALMPAAASDADETTDSSPVPDLNITLNPADASPFNNGRFEGWGTSLCWWANRMGYSEKLTQAAADAFFSEDGLGLDIARYNLGGGDDPSHNHITRSDSKVPGVWSEFSVSEDGKDAVITKYDLSKDQNQLNIAKAALKANPKLYFEGFSNSAPYFMTVSGCSSGSDPASSDNLKPDMYDDFAGFIADATALFKAEGIEFKSYSPMNEPDTSYWGANSNKQEGCHFDPGESQSKAIVETRKALDAKGLTDVIVAGMDETSIDSSVTNVDKLSADAKAALGRLDTHTYSGSKRAQLKAKALEIGKTLWMSEVDGGWDGFGLAQRIILDMNQMQPAAWVMWDIVDSHKDAGFTAPDGSTPEAGKTLNKTGSLWGVGMADHDNETLELANKYYMFGQFTKYINPGDTIIASSDTSLAAYNKDTGSIKVVVLNNSASDKSCVIDLSAFNKVGSAVKAVRSDNSSEKWADVSDCAVLENEKISTTLKAKSVTTYIVENNINDIGYLSISGPSVITKGEEVRYSAVSSDNSAVKWSVSDESAASIDENGTLRALNGGNIEVYAESASMGRSSYAVKVIGAPKLAIDAASVTGSAPWNNNAANGAQKVVDGSLSTYFDGLNEGYVLIDLGAPHKLAMIGYAPRSGYEYRMIDGGFSGSGDGESWTELYKVSAKPDGGVITYADELKNTDAAYRYIRYSVPSGKQSYNGKSEDYNCNIAEIEIYAERAPMSDAEKLAAAANSVNIAPELYGNITLPTALSDGAAAEWSTSDESVITAAGEITRAAEDKKAVLTAVFTLNDEKLTRTYDVTVRAAAAEKEMKAYLFTHFVGTESSADDEQIYFSVSQDGTSWTTLNEGAPILKSTVGENGVRDPHIIRSPEGDRFFLIATDLSIYGRRDDSNRWGTCQTSGSKSIVIWESKDLVSWSQARLVKVAPDNAGCTWAPESVYDDASGRYMVFWASKTSSDNYATQRIYRSYTRDFISFTEPEVYMDGGTVSNIDTTFLKDNGVYYRFTKNETKSSVIMEKSASLDGPFEEVPAYTLNGTAGNTVTGYEGPTAYKLNGENKWCLLLDCYSKSQGYKPFITDDISNGTFTSGNDFVFDAKYRHGTVMPISQDEYDALIKAYPPTGAPEEGELIFSMDFDNEDASKPELGASKVSGTLTYEDGYKAGKAARFDGSDHIEIFGADGSSLLAGLNSFTVSFMSKTDSQSWWFYASPDASAQTYKSEKYTGILDSALTVTAERYNSSDTARPSSASASYTSGEWKHIAVVYGKKSVSLYVNGSLVSTVPSSVDLKTLMGSVSVAYIGKANWGSGEYSNGLADDYRIYNYAMSAEEIAAEYEELQNKTPEPEIELTAKSVRASGAGDGVLTVAGYDENGAPIKAEIINGLEAALTGYESCKTIKAFWWDSIEGMKPVSQSAAISN